ncbi:MAG TPA: hypothetical protein VMV10_29505 [Pirellulales bacterium]|nr:hypothetical protein [Pirellulales bacterium]
MAVIAVLAALVWLYWPWRDEFVLRPVHEMKTKQLVLTIDGKQHTVEVPYEVSRLVGDESHHRPTQREVLGFVVIAILAVYSVCVIFRFFWPKKSGPTQREINKHMTELRIFVFGLAAGLLAAEKAGPSVPDPYIRAEPIGIAPTIAPQYDEPHNLPRPALYDPEPPIAGPAQIVVPEFSEDGQRQKTTP